MPFIAKEIQKIAQSVKDQKKLQVVRDFIKSDWENKETFLSILYKRLKDEVYNGIMSDAQKIEALKYFQDSQALVRPEEAELLFHSLGKLDEVSTNDDVTLDQFIKFIEDNTKYKLPKGFDKLFQPKQV